jgi:single-strand DNA-binding protein
MHLRDGFRVCCLYGKHGTAHVNAVTLIGSVLTEVQVRTLDDGRCVANFLVSVPRHGHEGRSDRVRIAVSNRQAEDCGRFLGPGSRVAIDGRLRSRSWDDRRGKRWHSVEVVATSVRFLSDPHGPAKPSANETESAMAS